MHFRKKQMENLDKELKTNIKEIVLSNDDEKSFCDIFIYEPENIEEKSLGSLYIIGEIVNLPENSSYIVNLLASIIKKEFYSNKKRTSLESLEAGLNKANSTLSDLTERGNVEWIGNLNMTCAAHLHKELHLSQTGKIKTLLIRNGQISDIGKNVILEKNPHPFRTFANIASGELETNDLVLFATPELFSALPLERISKLSTSLNFESFTNKIQELVGQNENINTLAALLVNVEKKEDEGKLPHVQMQWNSPAATSAVSEKEEETEYAFLKKQENEDVEEEMQNNAIETSKKMSLEDIIREFEEKNTLSHEEKAEFKMHQGQSFDESVDIIERIENPALGIKRMTIEENSFPEPTPQRPLEQKKITPEYFKNAKERIFAAFSALLNLSAEKLKSIKIKRPRIGLAKKINLAQNSKIVFAAFMLVAIVFVGNLVITNYSKKIEEERNMYNDLLSQSKAKIDEAEQILIYNDREKAREALIEAQKMATEVRSNYKNLSGEADQLIVKIATELDKIDNVSRISTPKVALDISKNEKIGSIESVIEFNGKYYAISMDSTVYEVNMADSSINEIQLALKNIGSDTGNAKLATTLSKTGEIVILTDKNKVITFDPKKTSLEAQKITLASDSANVKGLASYNSFIYLLDPSTNQIYKHQRTSSGFNNGAKWLPENNAVDIRNATSLSIDSTIYILKADGTIEKYLTGNKQKFSIQALKDPMINPTLLYTETALKNLYVADPQKNRIVLFDKATGNMVKQFIVKDLNGNIKTITVDEKEENIYVLSNKEVFQLGVKE